jgi:hypothetical protein
MRDEVQIVHYERKTNVSELYFREIYIIKGLFFGVSYYCCGASEIDGVQSLEIVDV